MAFSFFCKQKNLLDNEDLHYDIAFAELKCMGNFTILNTIFEGIQNEISFNQLDCSCASAC